MPTKEEAAAHVFLTSTALDHLLARGIVTRPARPGGWDLDAVREECIRHWRDVAAGRKTDGAGGKVLDLAEERAKLAAAQTEERELKNAELRRELVRASEIRAEWSRRTLTWKERIRAIPAAATVHVAGFTKPMARALLALIDETLGELADGRGDTPRKRSARRGRKAPKTAA